MTKHIALLGFKISNEDQKALNEYLLVTPRQWATDALKGMINKALKTILRDWLEPYKKTQVDSISGNIAVLIPAILAMPEFKPYNVESTEKRKAERTFAAETEIWEGGFEIADHEDLALRAFYKDPEQTLYDLMENKIALRKQAFVKKYTDKLISEQAVTIPNRHDAMINLITGEPGYKTRAQLEVLEA